MALAKGLTISASALVVASTACTPPPGATQAALFARAAIARTIRPRVDGGIRFFDAQTVAAIASGDGSAGLSPQEVAIVKVAEKVAKDATSVSEADIAVLRSHGLDDTEFFHVILAAAARCFFSTVLSAAGTQPDPQYAESLEPDLRQALSFGG